MDVVDDSVSSSPGGIGQSLNTPAEYYGVNSNNEWVIACKPGVKNAAQTSGFDVSEGLRKTNNNLWKEDGFVTELGLTDGEIGICRDMSIPMGLKNMGATCYVNSFIQSLCMIPEFCSLILALDVPEDSNAQLQAFQRLLVEMKHGLSKLADPTEFIDSFSIRHNLQEDCSEFSTLFLGWLDQVTSEYVSATIPSVRSFFEGQFEIKLLCSSCGDSRVLVESFLELRLELPLHSAKNAEIDLVAMLTKGTHMEDIIDGYFCSSCSKHTILVKSTRVSRLPPYLQLVINRYNFEEGHRKKIGALVNIPLLTISITTDQYICTGYLEHISNTATSGHYISHFRDGPSHWWTFDDAHVVRSEWGLEKPGVVSPSVYMVFLKRVVRASSCPVGALPAGTKILRQIQVKNETLQARSQVLALQRTTLTQQVSERRAKIDSFTWQTDVETEDSVRVIDKNFFVSWCRGLDIVAKFPQTLSPFVNSPCGHATDAYPHRFSPLLVYRNEVKFVPKSVAETMNLPYLPALADCVCEQCVADLDALLGDAIRYFSLLQSLRLAEVSFAVGGKQQTGVWINQLELPKPTVPTQAKCFESKDALFRRIQSSGKSSKNGSKSPVCDILQGVICPHGNLAPNATSEPWCVLKPKQLVEEIVELANKVFPSLDGILPKVVIMNDLIEYTGGLVGGGCTQCESESETIDSEWNDLVQLLSYALELEITKIEPGESYNVLPEDWVNKTKKFILNSSANSSKKLLPSLDMSMLVCPHGDLMVDVTDLENAKGSFTLVRETHARNFLAQQYQQFFKNTVSDLILPVVHRDPVNYVVGVAPPICGACHTKQSTPKISIRILPELVHEDDKRKSNGKPTQSLSRSKLIGVTQGTIDWSSLGIDIKIHLVDIGILEHSLSNIEPTEGIERMKIYLANPQVRGGLLEVSDGAAITDVIQESQVVDTIYVEFIQENSAIKVDTSHKIKRLRKPPSEEEAGFKGSLLRNS